MHRRSRLRSSRRAGFTLVELMVALMIGGLLIMALFSIGGGTSRHFQEQQRIGTTQRSVRMAMDRLRRDAARAGFLSVPSTNSPVVRVCPLPALARQVQGVWFDDADSAGNTALDSINRSAHATSADRLRFVGNYTTGDRYLVRAFNAGGNQVTLQRDWFAFRRSFAVAGSTTAFDTARFESVFRVGRMLHIETPGGQNFFVEITGSSLDASASSPSISISPAIQPGANPCLTGLGTGGTTVSPLSEVEYFIGTPTSASSSLTLTSSAVTGANTILYRHELNMDDGTELAGTRRAVLEYAIDFQVDFHLDNRTSFTLPPILALTDGATAENAVQNEAFRVRGIRASIAARTPEQDPRFPWISGDPGRYRANSTLPGASRVRRATTEIFMPNMVPR